MPQILQQLKNVKPCVIHLPYVLEQFMTHQQKDVFQNEDCFADSEQKPLDGIRPFQFELLAAVSKIKMEKV